jgi:hypothetical protein
MSLWLYSIADKLAHTKEQNMIGASPWIFIYIHRKGIILCKIPEFPSSPELGLPTPSPASECVPPGIEVEGRHTRLRWRGQDDLIRTTGQKL